jgi:hypothetical protein
MIIAFFLISRTLSCPDFSSETLLLEHVVQNPASSDSCALQALDKNWFETLFKLVQSSIFSDVIFSDTLKAEVKNKRKMIENLITQASSWGKMSTLAPAFQWAQSPNSTFLEIKFSHRLDSPGCSVLNDLKVEISSNHFYFSGNCLKSNQKVRFMLDFDTWDEVSPELSSYQEGKNGKLTVSLKKAKNDTVWELPLKGKKPGNLHIWWEMKDKFKKEMNKLTGEVDEDEKKKDDQFDSLLNNPNVVIENSYVNGKYVDNRKERGYAS